MRLSAIAVGVSLMSAAGFGQVPLSAFVNFEGAQTSPIRVSLDGSRLFAVNTPDGRVSVYDITTPARPVLLTEIPVGIEPVSVNPRNSDEAWVVNQESGTVSVISVSKGIVTDTIRLGAEPMDVVFAGQYAFVSVSRASQVQVYNAVTHQGVRSISLIGGNPRTLAVSPDGMTVYVAFALSGNHTTIITESLAPPQSPPVNPALPPPPKVGLIVDAGDPSWSWYVHFKMPDNDVAAIDTNSLTVRNYYSGVGTNNLGLAVRPNTGDIFVANTDALNLIHFETNLRGHWINSRISKIQVGSGQISFYDLNPGINYGLLPNPAALSTAISQPIGLTWNASGTTLYVASFGTDRVAAVDANGNIHAIIEVGPATGVRVSPATKRGPRGLALSGDGSTLYVLNRLWNSISLISTSQNTVISEMPNGTFDPTPTVIKNGRGFLYDAKLSGNGTGSCASCHVDAEMDHLAWDLGDPTGNMVSIVQNGQVINFHPMKGPMTTQTLRGLQGMAPYHWRGDKANFAAFNPAFNALMGGSPLSDSDMTAFTNFINTVAYPPNPNLNLDGSYPASIAGGNPQNGLTDFLTLPASTLNQTCNHCHLITPGPGSSLQIQNAPNQNQPFKIPQLREIYQKLLANFGSGDVSIDGFGIEHDGDSDNPFDLLRESVFGPVSDNAQTRRDIDAFLLCFGTGMAPAVGYSRTITQPVTLSALSDWNTLQGQAASGDADLIVKGTINGVVHGLVYQPAANNYKPDTVTLPNLTQLQLVKLISSGDTMTIMGVPPGSGVRMGIDRNLNGILDGDE